MKLLFFLITLTLSFQVLAGISDQKEIEDTVLLAQATQKDDQSQYHNLLELKEPIVFSPGQLSNYYQDGKVYTSGQDLDPNSAYCKIIYMGDLYRSKRVTEKAQLNELTLGSFRDRSADHADGGGIIGYSADINMFMELKISEPEHIARAWIFCRTATNNDPSGTKPTDPKSLNVGFLKSMLGKQLVNMFYK